MNLNPASHTLFLCTRLHRLSSSQLLILYENIYKKKKQKLFIFHHTTKFQKIFSIEIIFMKDDFSLKHFTPKPTELLQDFGDLLLFQNRFFYRLEKRKK